MSLDRDVVRFLVYFIVRVGKWVKAVNKKRRSSRNKEKERTGRKIKKRKGK